VPSIKEDLINDRTLNSGHFIFVKIGTDIQYQECKLPFTNKTINSPYKIDRILYVLCNFKIIKQCYNLLG